MQKLELILTRRKNKAVLYWLAGVFMVIMVFLCVGALLHEFEWFELVIGVLFLFGVLWVMNALKNFYFNKEVKLVVESDGETIRFFNLGDSANIFNSIAAIKLSDIKRFYIVQKRTRYFMHNYYFEYESKGTLGSLLKEKVECFPSLFKSDDDGRRQVLAFIKQLNPEIDLGYQNIFQKLAKK